MSWTLDASGTQTASINTEHTLRTSTANGTFCFIVDLVNMASGDILELRIKTKVLSGSTQHGAYIWTYKDAQNSDNNVAVSVPIPSDIQAAFTLKQTAGTGRSFDWKVLLI